MRRPGLALGLPALSSACTAADTRAQPYEPAARSAPYRYGTAEGR